MKYFLISLASAIMLALAILVGMLLYKYFITDRIMDRGGMINPDYIIASENAKDAGPQEEVTQ